jgi:peptide/nickel transport system permease protein
MDRLAYVLRRLAQLAPVAIGVTMVAFLLVRLLPGDPALSVLGTRATSQNITQLHHEWGLDRSIPTQYWLFVKRLAHGDLGDSFLYRVPVRSLVVGHTPVTLFLLAYSTVLALLIAVPIALLGARRKDGPADQVARAFPVVGLGMPAFWVGLMLIILFAAGGIGKFFPVGGYGHGFRGHVDSMFLPALTVAIGTAPLLIRSLRASLLGVLESDYITTARAKGVSERRVLVRHALRNAVMPMVTVLGINLGFLIGGTVVVEKVFALPGLGALIFDGILQRDFSIVQGVTLVFAAFVVLVNVAIDITYSLLDPRVRYD